MIEQLALAVKNGLSMNGEAIRSRIKDGNNQASFISQICIKANSRLDNPDNIQAAGMKEVDYLVASGYALPASLASIKGVPTGSETHILKIKRSGTNSIMYPIYEAHKEKNSAKVSEPDEVDPVFDPSKIAEEMFRFQIAARKRAAKGIR